MYDRGKIRYKGYATQLRDYTGLCYGNKTPTDIDGCIDFGGRAFWFLELKYTGVEMPFGQRIAFENLTKALVVPYIVLIAEHSCTEEEEIDAANCLVVEFRMNGAWHKPRWLITVKSATDRWLAYLESKGLL